MINIKPNLIGIAGNPQVGKNTVGKIILYLIYVEQKEKEGIIPTITLKDFIEKNITSAYCDWYIKRFNNNLQKIASILTGVSIDSSDNLLGKEWKVYYVKLESATHPIDKNTQRISRFYLSEQNVKDDWFKEKTPISNFEIANDILTTSQFIKLLEDSIKEVHPNILVNALFKDYQLQHGPSTYLNPYPSLEYPNWIISDLKHNNEFQAIKDRGGLCIKVINIEKYKPVTAMLAKTELSSCKFNFIIENFGTIDDLVEEVRKMLIHFKLLEK